MRIHRGWLVGGTVGAGIMLAALAGRTWGQPGELPGLRPPSFPPTVEKELPSPPRVLPGTPTSGTSAPSDAPASAPPGALPASLPASIPASLPATVATPSPEVIFPASLPTQAVPAPPVMPPPPGSLLTDALAPPSGKLPDAFDVLPTRSDSNVTTSTLPTDGKLGGKQEPAVSIEWIGPQIARLNHPMNCQILVRNTGPTKVHNVTVRQHLSAGVTCKRTEPMAATERDDLVWTVGTLAPGQQRRLEVTLVASQRGPLDCQATATFSSVAGQQVQVREPLLLVKMRMPEKAVVGDNVNLLFAVANPGDGVTELVKVKAVLPDGLDSPRGRIVELDVGSLNPKETRTLQIACVAKASGNHKCSLVATADGNLSATDHAFTDILQARLDLAVTGPKLRYLDRHAIYQIKVSNPGSAPAQNVVLSEVVPAGFRFHSASAGGRWDEGTKSISWQLGDLMPGQSRDVAIDLIAATMGDHKLQASVISSRGARTEMTAVTRVEGSSALVIELVDADDPVEVGGETTYEIRVTNAGTKTETNLELSCTLPEQMEFKGAKSAGGVRHRIEGREVIFEPLARLAPKADVIYRVTVRGTQAGDVRFRTRIRADGMPEPVVREESTRFYNDNILPR